MVSDSSSLAIVLPLNNSTAAVALNGLHRCQLCKLDAEWPALKSHLACVHAEYRPHGCVQCDFNSPDFDEMVAHSRASQHFVNLNQHFDEYKERLTKRLIDDHLPKKSEGSATVVGESLAQPLKVEPSAKIDAPHVVKTPAVKKSGEKVLKPSPAGGVRVGDRRQKSAAKKSRGKSAAKKSRGKSAAKKGHKGSKGPVRMRCRYPGCGAEGVTAKNSHWHIQKEHVSGAFHFPCPVVRCAQKVEGKEPHRFALNSLSSHICMRHGGVKSLTEEEKAQYQVARKTVNEEVGRLRLQCFPNDDGDGNDGNDGGDGMDE